MIDNTSDAHVLAVVEQAVSDTLPAAAVHRDRSFLGAGGTSVQALMIVDDIIAGLALSDALTDRIMTALLLTSSLASFPSSVLQIIQSHATR